MPNLYATVEEIKAAVPDGIRQTTIKYNAVLTRLSEAISRMIDRRCGRVFYPSYGVRYFAGDGSDTLVVPDLFEIDAIAYSLDDQTFTALTTDDYYGASFEDENSLKSYRTLIATSWGDVLSWPSNRRGVKITGWWGFAEERANAFEASGATLASDYTAGATSMSVADASLIDLWGVSLALQPGRILRVDDELLELVGVTDAGTGNDTLSVIGGRNGSTAAGHSTSDVIYAWRVAEDIKQACIIQAMRQLERGLQGFGDARVTPELGSSLYIKKIDPEADMLLQPYMAL